MNELRVIFDPPASGAWNMAVDETLLETAGQCKQPSLRFYTWNEPTLSVGYFQSLAERAQHAASRNCPVVRRASGGGAILHDRELTYSLAIPHKATSSSAATRLVETVHATLIATLSEFGLNAALYSDRNRCENEQASSDQPPFLCFLRRTCSDIIYEDAKIVGSAQRRRRGAVMQHGSILLGFSDRAPELPGIQELASLTINPVELADRWTPRLAGVLGLPFGKGFLSSTEQTLAKGLRQSRFASAQHLERR